MPSGYLTQLPQLLIFILIFTIDCQERFCSIYKKNKKIFLLNKIKYIL